MSEEPSLGEKALNKTAEVGLSSQLDAVEDLQVSIKTQPLKLIQGEVEQVDVVGEGLVMEEDLRLTKMEMQITSIAINPRSVVFGKIELTKPTQGQARVVLTETDINRAFNSEYVRNKLQKQKISVKGKQITISPQQVDFYLPGEGKIIIKANILLVETFEVQQIGFTAIPHISNTGKTVYLKNVEHHQGQEISQELTQSLIDATSEILNLNNFDLQGMSLRLHELEVEKGNLILHATADIEKIPNA